MSDKQVVKVDVHHGDLKQLYPPTPLEPWISTENDVRPRKENA